MRWIILLAIMLMPAAAIAADRPNVVVILADDQGWGDLSCNGNTNLATPNIDSLAAAGATLERFYVQPVCSPTRAEFFTGRYHPRGGVRGVTTGAERLNLDERTIGDVFKAAGYATGAFGKWHNGTQWPYHPNARGFEEYYGFTSGHWGTYFDSPLDHNGKMVTGSGYVIDDLTDRAMAFIDANRQRPFFCYVPYNTPHSPMQVPDKFFAKFADADLKMRAENAAQEEIEHTRAALAMCENIDWNVGRILKKLDELKLAENTIVIYFSDNGPNGWRWNGGMKGRKGSVDEGGVRSPCFIRWPAAIGAGRRVAEISGAIDLLPTLAQCASVDIRSPHKLDGVSLKPLLMGESARWPERMIFAHWGGKSGVRTPRYRLDHTGALFDMQADPGQKRDIASEQPTITAELSKAVQQWKADVLPAQRKDDRPFTVGYTESPVTQLPARDGVPHGNVRRSANAPNCSYFTNWSSAHDRITWDIEVATTGTYEATAYYTCAAGEEGSTIELSFNGSGIGATVAEAHDPPLTGRENDRVHRGSESYVKDFKPLRLGEFKLAAGRGELALRAFKIAGKQVMDVRMVLLTLEPEISSAAKSGSAATVAHVGKVRNKSLVEASGLIASTKHDGIFWTHNDGDDGHLYAIRSDGTVVGKIEVDERFQDWEDIAADAKGNLYLADVGNNERSRKTATVYRLPEPNPRDGSDVKAAEAYRLTFPGKPFNCESLFIIADHGYVVSKVPEGSPAMLYRFALTVGRKKQVLEEIATLPVNVEVTAADISPDGKRLALLNNSALFVIELDGSIADAATARPKRFSIPAAKAEGCCFADDGVLVIAESGEIFRVRLDAGSR